LQLPLEVQLQYAPSTSIIGSVTGGVDVSLSQLSIPVNVRLVAGGAAGTISGAQQEGSQKRPTHPVAGTVLGGSSGYESKVFRLDLRYEWIKNFVGNGPDIQEFQLRAGWAF